MFYSFYSQMCFYFVYLYIFFSFFSSAVSMFCGCRSFACALSIKWHNYIPLGPTFHGIWRLKGHGRVVSSRPVVPQGKSIPFRGKELLSAVLCRPVFRYRVADGSTLCTSGFVCVCVGGGRGHQIAHSCLFCSCVCFCLYGSFNCISFHKSSRRLSVFSLCSAGLISALSVLSTVYL